MTELPIRTVGLIDVEPSQQEAASPGQPSPISDLLTDSVFETDQFLKSQAVLHADAESLADELLREIEIFRRNITLL